jgi:RHS repeat-associated protein
LARRFGCEAVEFDYIVIPSGRYFVGANGIRIGMHTTTVSGSSSTTANRYFVLDHLGSTAVIADDTAGSIRASTNRGFTSHEHIDDVGLINMNARVYDPAIGRFMSADPLNWISWQSGNDDDKAKFVKYLADPQNLDLYTYVKNRPLTLTDPTGLQDTETVVVTGYYSSGASWQPSLASSASFDINISLYFKFGGVLSNLTSLQLPKLNINDLSDADEEVHGDGYRDPPKLPNGNPRLPSVTLDWPDVPIPIKPPKPSARPRDATNKGNQKPGYCSSLGYKLGSFISDVGGTAQDVGVGVAGAGVVTVAVSWWTGAGDVVGGGMIAGGGTIYTSGTAVDELGNGIKYLSGQSAGNTVVQGISVPLMKLDPVARMASDKLLKGVESKEGFGDPCEP